MNKTNIAVHLLFLVVAIIFAYYAKFTQPEVKEFPKDDNICIIAGDMAMTMMSYRLEGTDYKTVLDMYKDVQMPELGKTLIKTVHESVFSQDISNIEEDYATYALEYSSTIMNSCYYVMANQSSVEQI